MQKIYIKNFIFKFKIKIMTRKRLLAIINEEITKVKWGIVKEEITTEDEKLIRDIIRREVSAIFFDLFKKRKTWGA